ncbi:MAG: flagellar basal body rod protein FlgC [Steroidobacter sp.]
MSMFRVLDISSAGLSVEQARLEAASSNLANANTTRTASGSMYQPLEVVVGSKSVDGADGLVQKPVVLDVVPTNAEPRMVYAPGHPDANSKGFVAMPGVDTLTTMMDLMSISRSYEANLRVFDVTRTLLQKTLEMGARS